MRRCTHLVHQHEDVLDGCEVEAEVALALGVLDLDDHRRPVAQPRAVDLTDGCRADGRLLEIVKDLLDLACELLLHNLLDADEWQRRHILLQHLERV